MSMDDLMAVFDNCSFSVFDTFSEPGATLPYCVLIVTDPDNTAADNKVYCVNAEVRAELYTGQGLHGPRGTRKRAAGGKTSV